MQMMSNENNVAESVDADKLVLIVPPKAEPKAGFPLKVNRLDTKAMIAALVDPETKFPFVVEMEADVILPISKLMAKLDLTLEVLDGLEGEYPSYWRLQTSVLPRMAAAEIEAAAITNKIEKESKGPQLDMKGLRPAQAERIAEMAKEDWADDSSAEG